MEPSVRQLKAFVVIAATGSFVEASERLHMSQPALSISIKKLEDMVGGALFNRTTRGVQLTPEGKVFLPIAQRLIGDWQEAFEDLGKLFSKQRGKVTLAALPTLAAGFLPTVLAQFRARYPNIAISVNDVLASEIDELVREGRADIGLSVEPSDTTSFNFEPLLEDQFIAVFPDGHPLVSQTTVSWEELLQFPLIELSKLSSTRQAIERVLEKLPITMDLFCEVSQIGTAGRMVAAGLGVAALPSLSFNLISNEGLNWRPLTNPSVPRVLGIILPSRVPQSAAANALLHDIRQYAVNNSEV